MGTLWLGFFIFWLLCAVYAAHIAEQKQAGNEGFWMGLLLGPTGVIAAGFLDRRPNCPQCGGRLNASRTKAFPICPHCRQQLPKDVASSHESRPVAWARLLEKNCLFPESNDFEVAKCELEAASTGNGVKHFLQVE